MILGASIKPIKFHKFFHKTLLRKTTSPDLDLLLFEYQRKTLPHNSKEQSTVAIFKKNAY